LFENLLIPAATLVIIAVKSLSLLRASLSFPESAPNPGFKQKADWRTFHQEGLGGGLYQAIVCNCHIFVRNTSLRLYFGNCSSDLCLFHPRPY
jgi:hypothetical protein